MAGYIKGITIEFGADTTKLNEGLKKTQGTLNKTQNELRAIDKSLKFNPGNTTLLKQKFDLLTQSVNQTEEKLKQLKSMEQSMNAAGVDKSSAQYRELQREIIKTENNLKQAQGSLKSFGSIGKQQALAVGNAFQTAGSKIKAAGRSITTAVSVYGVAGIYAGAKLIESSQKQDQAEQKLVEIYKTRMGASKSLAKETMNLASSLQKQGVVGDEVALSFAQQMATYSSAPSTVNKLMPAFENLLVQQKGLNGTQEDAVGLANMFGKALMGQTGALKKAGISFTEEQEAVLKYGTEEEKAAMMAEVITQNVGNMNAEFAKTDAGKIQQAKNALGDMGEEIGAVLLPAVADLVSWFQDKMLPKLQSLIDMLKEHPAIAKFALAMAALTAVLGPLIMIIGSLVSAVGGVITIFTTVGPILAGIAGPVGIVVAAIAAAIAIGIALYKNWDKIKAGASALWKHIKTVFLNIKSAIVAPIKAAKEAVGKIIEKIKGFFDFKFKLPKIKLPHFGIQPRGWHIGDLLEGIIPSLGIEWYKKGGIFRNPSVIGVGEAGPEAVLPIDKLQSIINSSNSQLVGAMITALRSVSMGGDGGEYEITINLGGAKVATEVYKLSKQGKMILEA